MTHEDIVKEIRDRHKAFKKHTRRLVKSVVKESRYIKNRLHEMLEEEFNDPSRH